MRNTLFQGWTENQMRAEFAKANAELAGLQRRSNDAFKRRARFAAMIKAANSTPPPTP